MRKLIWMFVALALATAFTGCKKEEKIQVDTEPDSLILETDIIVDAPEEFYIETESMESGEVILADGEEESGTVGVDDELVIEEEEN